MALNATELLVNLSQAANTFAIRNRWVAGGSALPTQGSANPAWTIMAMAARVADRMLGRRKAWAGP